MNKKKPTRLRAKSIVYWLIGVVLMAAAFVVFTVYVFQYSMRLRPFEQQQRVWVSDNRDFFVEGVCRVEAGSQANFQLIRKYGESDFVRSILVQGIELGSTSRTYSITTALDTGQWKVNFIPENGQVASNPGSFQLVEVVFSCDKGSVQTNLVTDRTMPWAVTLVLLCIFIVLCLGWSSFMDVRLE